MLTSAKLDATGHRWLAALSTHNFSLKYRSGVQNINADALSRRPHPTSDQEQEWKDISTAGVRAMCQISVVTYQRNPCLGRAIDNFGPSMHAIPQAYCNLSTLSTKGMPILSLAELLNDQREDSAIGEVWPALSHGDVTQVGSQVAERVEHRASNLKVASSIPGRCT